MSSFIYQTEISHPGLNKYYVAKATSRSELEDKVRAKRAQWDEEWARKVEQQRKRTERERKQQNDEKCQQYAAVRTKQAESQQEQLDRIIVDRKKPKLLNAKDLKDCSVFPENPPSKPKLIDIHNPPERAFSTFSVNDAKTVIE